MFIKKEKFDGMVEKIYELKKQIRDLEFKQTNIANLEEEIMRIKEDLENEHLENCEQHRKLLKIQRRIEKPFTGMKDAIDLRNDIKSVLLD
jgi:pyruvate formate-lyase activating enzyme-like uncharacterized protein